MTACLVLTCVQFVMHVFDRAVLETALPLKRPSAYNNSESIPNIKVPVELSGEQVGRPPCY